MQFADCGNVEGEEMNKILKMYTEVLNMYYYERETVIHDTSGDFEASIEELKMHCNGLLSDFKDELERQLK